MMILIPRKVAPRGLPSCRRGSSEFSLPSARDVLSRKSCVTAMPIEAKASEVRNQARKVRSTRQRED